MHLVSRLYLYMINQITFTPSINMHLQCPNWDLIAVFSSHHILLSLKWVKKKIVLACFSKPRGLEQFHFYLCSMWSQSVPDLWRWFSRADHNPSSMRVQFVYTCMFMLSSTIRWQSDNPQGILIPGVNRPSDAWKFRYLLSTIRKKPQKLHKALSAHL